jgi:hypothetical protein
MTPPNARYYCVVQLVQVLSGKINQEEPSMQTTKTTHNQQTVKPRAVAFERLKSAVVEHPGALNAVRWRFVRSDTT